MERISRMDFTVPHEFLSSSRGSSVFQYFTISRIPQLKFLHRWHMWRLRRRSNWENLRKLIKSPKKSIVIQSHFPFTSSQSQLPVSRMDESSRRNYKWQSIFPCASIWKIFRRSRFAAVQQTEDKNPLRQKINTTRSLIAIFITARFCLEKQKIWAQK